jgi:hypothetical protein
LLIHILHKIFKKEHISDEVLEHSSKGEYTKTNRLKSGGHGQEAIDYMDNHNIKYNIKKTYKNGVRVGNVPEHINRKNRENANHSWFPKNWGRDQIKKAGQAIGSKSSKDENHTTGKYKNVTVTIIRSRGKIATIFPNSNQSSKNKKQHKKG